ncbi:MAG: hypothetical protein P4L65_08430 [Legionella sp.]|nr:hypothetical protein [Legionella sp.]
MLYYTKDTTFELVTSLDKIIGFNKLEASQQLILYKEYFNNISPFIESSEAENILDALIEITDYLSAALVDSHLGIIITNENLYNTYNSIQIFAQELLELEFSDKENLPKKEEESLHKKT